MDKIIDCFANKLVNYFTFYKYVDKTKRNVYLYGTVVAIQSTVNILSTLIIGAIFQLFLENLCFFLVFRLLRKYSGGFHSTKFSICFIISIILNILFLSSYEIFMIYQNNFLVLMIALVSSIIIVFFSPITNKNKELKDKECVVYKLITVIICLTSLIVSVILMKKNNVFIYSICMALIFDSISIIISKVAPYIKISK